MIVIDPKQYGIDLAAIDRRQALTLADVARLDLVAGRRSDGRINAQTLQRWSGYRGAPAGSVRVRFPAVLLESGIYVTMRSWVEAFAREVVRRKLGERQTGPQPRTGRQAKAAQRRCKDRLRKEGFKV